MEYVQSAEKSYELGASSPVIHELEARPPPIVPRQEGFVQRIKTLLNERAAFESSPRPDVHQEAAAGVIQPEIAAVTPDDELVELPGSFPHADESEPVQRAAVAPKAESNALETRPSVRITKEMVQSLMGPSSSSSQGTETIELQQPHADKLQSLEGEMREPIGPDSPGEVQGGSRNIPEDPLPQRATSSAAQKPKSIATGDSQGVPEEARGSLGELVAQPTSEKNQDALDENERRCETPSTDLSVSSLKPGEDGSQDSVVSPVGTQTLQAIVQVEDGSNGAEDSTTDFVASPPPVAADTVPPVQTKLPPIHRAARPDESTATIGVITVSYTHLTLPTIYSV